jgi:hypothetical protein
VLSSIGVTRLIGCQMACSPGYIARESRLSWHVIQHLFYVPRAVTEDSARLMESDTTTLGELDSVRQRLIDSNTGP